MKTLHCSAAIAALGLLAAGAAQAVQTVEFQNVTHNGAAITTPLFVGAGDLLKFDAVLTANGAGNPPNSSGLGLCLQYNKSALAEPTFANLLQTQLLADGAPTPLDPCTAGGGVPVPGADTTVVKGWASVSGNTWPGAALPLKLYDAQFQVLSSPAGLTRFGFAAKSVASGQQFTTNGPMTLCGKPTVTVSATTDGTESGSVSAMIAIALSSPIPVECGVDGSFPVTLALAGTASTPGQPNADYTIGGTRISASGATITAMFPADGATASLTFAAKPVDDAAGEGTETLTLTVLAGSGNYGGVGTAASASIGDNDLTGTVVEYLDTLDFPGSPGGHFFYSSDPAEQAAVDAGAAGKFNRTGRTFKTGGTSPVCRFYGSIAPGPNSHFFTVSPDECNQLKALQVTPVPLNVQQWNYERIEYNTTPPVIVNGTPTCPAGTLPLYRAYNNAFPLTGPKNPWDSNHRFTPNLADIAEMVNAGWRNEGLVFCTTQ